MTQENAQRQRISDIGHGRVFMSSCVYEFTLGERTFQDSRNNKIKRPGCPLRIAGPKSAFNPR
jgi:hypothetical protein